MDLFSHMYLVLLKVRDNAKLEMQPFFSSIHYDYDYSFIYLEEIWILITVAAIFQNGRRKPIFSYLSNYVK